MSEQIIVLATTNPGKVRELAAPLEAFGLKVVGLDAFPGLPEVEETGDTFAANALLKARAVAEATGLAAVADDSGLMVDALDGAPGVHSARYWQSGDTVRGVKNQELSALPQDERNILKLMDAMRDVAKEQRGVQFCCAMCAVRPGTPDPLVSEGVWRGVLLEAPAGEGGFGYDPLFLDPELCQTAAQMPAHVKMQRSHRARALASLLRQWPDFWNPVPTSR